MNLAAARETDLQQIYNPERKEMVPRLHTVILLGWECGLKLFWLKFAFSAGVGRDTRLPYCFE